LYFTSGIFYLKKKSGVDARERKKKFGSSSSQFGLPPPYTHTPPQTTSPSTFFQVVNFTSNLFSSSFLSFLFFFRQTTQRKRATTFAHEAHHRGVHKPAIMTGKRRTFFSPVHRPKRKEKKKLNKKPTSFSTRLVR
jgi:hypothetical protein